MSNSYNYNIDEESKYKIYKLLKNETKIIYYYHNPINK